MDPQKVVLGATLYRLSAIGMNLGACVFVGLGLGWLCRRYFHWGDWVVITGILVGVLAGFTESLREIRVLTRDPQKSIPKIFPSQMRKEEDHGNREEEPRHPV